MKQSSMVVSSAKCEGAILKKIILEKSSNDFTIESVEITFPHINIEDKYVKENY